MRKVPRKHPVPLKHFDALRSRHFFPAWCQCLLPPRPLGRPGRHHLHALRRKHLPYISRERIHCLPSLPTGLYVAARRGRVHAPQRHALALQRPHGDAHALADPQPHRLAHAHPVGVALRWLRRGLLRGLCWGRARVRALPRGVVEPARGRGGRECLPELRRGHLWYHRGRSLFRCSVPGLCARHRGHCAALHRMLNLPRGLFCLIRRAALPALRPRLLQPAGLRLILPRLSHWLLD